MHLRRSPQWPLPAILPAVILLAFVFLLGGGSGAIAQAVPASGLSKVVIGYYAGWNRAEFGHLKIDYSALTHIAHAFTWPDSGGDLVLPDDYLYPELVRTAHENGVKMIMSVGGWGNCEGFPGMAATASTRRRFIGQVVEFCGTQGYDGVDIDWEFPSNETERDNFSSLIIELSTALHGMTPPRVLTMAASSGDYYGQWIDFENLVASFDYIGFMTYDFHGSWSGHSGYNSPLYTCDNDPDGSMDETLSYALQRRVPLSKILLGIPFYGRSFDSPNPGGSFQTTRDVSFTEAMELWNQGWGYHWDDCAKVPYLSSPSGTEIISFDDPFSVYWKCAYVTSQQAAGIIIWELTQDNFRNTPLLIKIVALAFQK
jgi:chitinase